MASQEMCSVECMRVRGTRHRSAIGCRRRGAMQTHAAFARGHLGFDSALCVVGGGSWLSEKRCDACFLPQVLFFFALGPFAVMIRS